MARGSSQPQSPSGWLGCLLPAMLSYLAHQAFFDRCSTRLITSLLPSGEEEMSKHVAATGMCRPAIAVARDRLELLIDQIKVIERRHAYCWAAVSSAAAMLLALKGIGLEFAAALWTEVCPATTITAAIACPLGRPGGGALEQWRDRSRAGRVEIR